MADILPSQNTLPDPDARITLRLLATTDVHGHLLPWDDLSNRPAPGCSLASVARLIDAARAEQPQSVLLDNGDFLNGCPLSDHEAESWKRGRPLVHPVIRAMNLLGYDAATLGNHEFSHGLPFLRAALRQAAFPVVATNVSRRTGHGTRPLLARSLLLNREVTDAAGRTHRLKLGIIGFLPPQTTQWERAHLEGRVVAEAILPAARRILPRLRRAGADLIIALAHSGLGSAEAPDGAENIALRLAKLPGLSAVIAGHIHSTFASPADGSPGAPVLMPGFFGSHLGVLDLHLSRSDQGWQVTSHRAELRPVAERDASGALVNVVPPCEAVEAVAAESHRVMQKAAATRVGETLVPLNSYLALVGPSAIQTLLAEAQIAHMQPRIAALPEAGLPILAAVAPFKAGGRGGPDNYTAIPAGPLTLRNITDLYLHPNTPVALCLTGAEIALWLERSASLFRHIPAGTTDTLLIDPAFPAYNFDMIHGLTYQIDPSQPARFDQNGIETDATACRIRNLRYQSRPVAETDRFVVVTNSYRASGGQGFAGADEAHVICEDHTPLRLVLRDHVARAGRVAPSAVPGWRFAPLPGTSALFDTSPEATPLAKAHGLEPLGPQPSGFLRFRLRF